MKITKFFAAALAATTLLASCNKEPGERPEGEKAQLTIGVSPKTRAAGTVTGDADNKVNEFKAFVFQGNKLQATLTSTSGAAVTDDNVTTAATEIYVVANANDLLATGITDKPTLMAKLGNLDNAGACSQTSASGGDIWASGNIPLSAANFTLNASDKYEATVSVPLSFVPARLNVTVVNNMTNQNVTGALTVTDIMVYNAGGQTKFFGASLIPSTYVYYAGEDMTTFNNKPAAYDVKGFLTNAYNATSGNHFYVFENDATALPTILSLKATYGSQTRYFPIHFTTADAGYVIERGKSYNVTLTLTGDADPNSGTNPGTPDPTNPIVKANLTVDITVATWDPVVINKEF